MAKIQVLDKSVAELIAAGEVVERPASIVKELVENSIDAGATKITIEIKGGGIGYVRITDNGSGISSEDVPTAFLRHATSKVQSIVDLGNIDTLGFRGEALSSIASVSKIELTTKTENNLEGTKYIIDGGEEVDFSPAGAPNGTTIIVRDVFYNIPARMKFLRKDVTEGNAVAQIIDKCALSHPEIAFSFIRDTQVKLKTSGNGDLQATIASVYDQEFAKNMLPVNYSFENRITVKGYVCSSASAKSNRSYQSFFINSRYVRTQTCSIALEQAFKGKLMVGKFPTCVLNIQVDSSFVDPNVHPAKTEVRFAEEKPIFNAVYYAVKNALTVENAPLDLSAIPRQSNITLLTLELDDTVPQQQRLDNSKNNMSITMEDISDSENHNFSKKIPFASSRKEENEGKNKFYPTSFDEIKTPLFDTILAREIHANKNKYPQDTATDEITEVSSINRPINLRFIGELFGIYILLEQGGEFLLVDKHAAHEQILYKKIRENADRSSHRQVLLSPMPVTLERDEYSTILDNLDILSQFGFLVEDFGSGTLIVRETPVELDGQDVNSLLSEIAEKLITKQNDLTPTVLESLYRSIACKSAVRAGDVNNPVELKEIIDLLTKNPDITHCPHGRPVVLRVSQKEIEKMFGRLG